MKRLHIACLAALMNDRPPLVAAVHDAARDLGHSDADAARLIENACHVLRERRAFDERHRRQVEDATGLPHAETLRTLRR